MELGAKLGMRCKGTDSVVQMIRVSACFIVGQSLMAALGGMNVFATSRRASVASISRK